MEPLCRHLAEISKKIPLIFPVHPRTSGNLKAFGHHKHIQSNKLKATSPPALARVLDEIADLLS